jgi:hypothetical protein
MPSNRRHTTTTRSTSWREQLTGATTAAVVVAVALSGCSGGTSSPADVVASTAVSPPVSQTAPPASTVDQTTEEGVAGETTSPEAASSEELIDDLLAALERELASGDAGLGSDLECTSTEQSVYVPPVDGADPYTLGGARPRPGTDLRRSAVDRPVESRTVEPTGDPDAGSAARQPIDQPVPPEPDPPSPEPATESAPTTSPTELGFGEGARFIAASSEAPAPTTSIPENCVALP